MLPRILIVDDESSICISLSLALEPEYEVVWETDPIRALERFRPSPSIWCCWTWSSDPTTGSISS